MCTSELVASYSNSLTGKLCIVQLTGCVGTPQVLPGISSTLVGFLDLSFHMNICESGWILSILLSTKGTRVSSRSNIPNPCTKAKRRRRRRHTFYHVPSWITAGLTFMAVKIRMRLAFLEFLPFKSTPNDAYSLDSFTRTRPGS